MRIAVLSWESLHSIAVGGMASHVSELAAAMERKGHEVHVFTRLAPGQRYHDVIDGVHYHRCTYASHPEFVDEVNNMCRAFVDRVFAAEDLFGPFDIVHAHDWLAANAMIWIKQGRGRKCVLTIHATEYARCGNTFPGGRSARVRDQERAGTYWADRLITVSKAARDEIRWMYEVPDWKMSVVYNGVSPHRFDKAVDPGAVKARYRIGPLDSTVLYCGRLEWQKGPDLLVEAIPAVLHRHGNAKFVFLGDGGMRGQLEHRANQLGVAHAVRFLGYRNGEELIDLFKSAETICVPSRNEPFGIVVLEAWAAHKPVVATLNGGPNEYVSHEWNGLKIYPHPGSVVWGLTQMFSNFDRARWMGENGRRTVEERFTWDMIVDQTLAVYGVQPAAVAKPAEVKPAAARPEAVIVAAVAAMVVEPVEVKPAVAVVKPAEVEPVAARPEAVTVAAAAATDAAPAEVEPVAARPEAVPAAAAAVAALAAAPAASEVAPRRQRVRARLSVWPKTPGFSVADALAACRKVLAQSGLRLRQCGRSMIIEGNLDEVSGAVQKCYQVADVTGEIRVTITPLSPAEPRRSFLKRVSDLAAAMPRLRIPDERRALSPHGAGAPEREMITGSLA